MNDEQSQLDPELLDMEDKAVTATQAPSRPVSTLDSISLEYESGLSEISEAGRPAASTGEAVEPSSPVSAESTGVNAPVPAPAAKKSHARKVRPRQQSCTWPA